MNQLTQLAITSHTYCHLKFGKSELRCKSYKSDRWIVIYVVTPFLKRRHMFSMTKRVWWSHKASWLCWLLNLYGVYILRTQSNFIVNTNDHDHRCLKSLIGCEMSGSPTTFNTCSPRIEVTMGERVRKWMRKWHGILHGQKWILFGGHPLEGGLFIGNLNDVHASIWN